MDPKGLVIKSFAAAVFGVFSLQASAATVTFNLDYEFSGAQQPQGPGPWAVATIGDNGTDTVRLTMMATNLVDSEFISGWYFNYSGDANALTFTPFDIGDATVNSVQTGADAFKADGDGFFDILFDLAPPPGNMDARLMGGEQLVYDITLTGGGILSASDFNLFSAPGGGNGSYLSAAHVQSIADPSYCGPDDACGSGWIGAVPVPAAVWLFGSGLLGLVGVARRKLA